MEDMLHYLNRDFTVPPDGKLLLVATRHEDGSWAKQEAQMYHQQRAQLFRTLGEQDGVTVEDWADTKHATETAQLILDYATFAVNLIAIAPLVASWISSRPKKETPTVPGIVCVNSKGDRMDLTHLIPEAERKNLVKEFFTRPAAADPGKS